MSGLFHRLATRALGTAPVAEPIVPSVFAPSSRTEQIDMPVERPVSPARPSKPTENTSSTLPSPVASHVEKAVRDAFEPHRTHKEEPSSQPEPRTMHPIDPEQPKSHAAEPKRALPQLPNFVAQRQDKLDAPANRASVQPAPQFVPSTAAAQITSREVRREAAPADASSPNIIRVSIGRIDVRAETPAPLPSPAPRPRPATMTLDEYAKLRAEGKR